MNSDLISSILSIYNRVVVKTIQILFQNNLTFQVELHRLNGPRDYKFISWSLPKPPRNEKNVNQIRYGRTGMYGWGEYHTNLQLFFKVC